MRMRGNAYLQFKALSQTLPVSTEDVKTSKSHKKINENSNTHNKNSKQKKFLSISKAKKEDSFIIKLPKRVNSSKPFLSLFYLYIGYPYKI
jgi:hypothetical protein